MIDEDYAYGIYRQRKLDAKTICPVCKGVRGINVSEGMKDEDGNELAPDWFDCDNCDATGFVSA